MLVFRHRDFSFPTLHRMTVSRPSAGNTHWSILWTPLSFPFPAPESAGLLALSLGLSRLHVSDHVMLNAPMPLYDALYARCQSSAIALWQGVSAEKHSWPLTMARAA